MSQDMMRKLKVTVNDKLYLVEVGDLQTSPIMVKVNGQAYTVDIESADGEGMSVEGLEPASKPAAHEPAIPVKMPAPTSTDGSSAKAVKAPMPGNITKISVELGDHVTVGQELCSLEAMKMNNAIRSPREGVIASVEVTLGQAVNHNDVLLTFE